MGNESQTPLVMRVAAGVRAAASMKRRSPDNAYWDAPPRDEYANAWGVSGATNRH